MRPIMVRPAMITPQAELLATIEPFLRERKMAETAFGLSAVNDGKLIARLRRGANITASTQIRVRAFIQQERERAGEAIKSGAEAA